MASLAKLVSIFFLFSFITTKTTSKTCPITYCSSIGSSSPVKFPFGPFQSTVQNRDSRCSYPGFDLISCQDDTQTTISLPSGDFAVRMIHYGLQILTIDDPQTCLPKRLLSQNFTVLGTPFTVRNFGSFTFLNCSSTAVSAGDELVTISCLSGSDFTVKAIPTVIFTAAPPSCSVISEVLVPLTTSSQRWLENWRLHLNAYIVLYWDEPSCDDCERRGGDCGFKSDTGLEIGCFNVPRQGIPKGVQYMLYLAGGVGIIIFICYNFPHNRCLRSGARIYNNRSRNQQSLAADPNINITVTQNSGRMVVRGLDEKRIESYPKTWIGESSRLPKDSDNTCSICLSEYKVREALRTIPDCGHYFHDDCIVKWLRLNATCPLCRNLPQRPTGE
ncbi:hypothetical protein UlMin_042519 [Ulmus minor]